MLSKLEQDWLRLRMIPEEDIAQIVSVDPDTCEVTFENGDKHTICECWTRVMGYYRPASHYNLGKKSEYRERMWFNEKVAMDSPVFAVKIAI